MSKGLKSFLKLAVAMVCILIAAFGRFGTVCHLQSATGGLAA